MTQAMCQTGLINIHSFLLSGISFVFGQMCFAVTQSPTKLRVHFFHENFFNFEMYITFVEFNITYKLKKLCKGKLV